MSPVKDQSVYGPDWHAISYAVKERAGWRCECTGQCGEEHDGGGGHPGRCHLTQGYRLYWRKRAVVLTVHHINQLPWDHRPENLLALCEGCHNRLDMPMRQEHARETRERTKGFQALFGDPS